MQFCDRRDLRRQSLDELGEKGTGAPVVLQGRIIQRGFRHLGRILPQRLDHLQKISIEFACSAGVADSVNRHHENRLNRCRLRRRQVLKRDFGLFSDARRLVLTFQTFLLLASERRQETPRSAY